MNYDFVPHAGFENLENGIEAAPIGSGLVPAADPAAPPQQGGAVKKNNGNMPVVPPSQDGYITQLVGPDGVREFHCSVSQVVEGCEDYYPLLKLLWNALETDVIYIDIFSYGGEVETGCHIITAMMNTKAKVITKAYGLCCSIGAMIWVCGTVREVTDNATIMFHMPSGGVFGKTADNKEECENVQLWFTEFMRSVSRGILTESELDDIVNCRHDHFIPAKTMKERLAIINNASAGTEGLNDCILSPDHRHWLTNKTRYSDDITSQPNSRFQGLKDCVFDLCAMKPRNLIFTRDDMPNGHIAWTFYMTGSFITERMIKDFVHKMHLPAPEDEVFIHCPSELDLDSAEIISSAITSCKAHVTTSAPYVLDTGAAIVATSGNRMVPFSYGIMIVGIPQVAAFGKLIDSENAIRIHKIRIGRFLQKFKAEGFIPDDESFMHIVKQQGTSCVHCAQLCEIIKQYNTRNTK